MVGGEAVEDLEGVEAVGLACEFPEDIPPFDNGGQALRVALDGCLPLAEFASGGVEDQGTLVPRARSPKDAPSTSVLGPV